MAKVLVCGTYFSDRENSIAGEIEEFTASQRHEVEQRWIALEFGGGQNSKCAGTVAVVNEPTPKFTLINGLLKDLKSFDYVIVADDDVDLPAGFVDNFLGYVDKFKFALSQPARRPDGHIEHFITTQMPGIDGRLTRFVEIGPVFCLHRSSFHLLTPFDIRSPMGLGYDFVWPLLLDKNGLRMGIVDATPIGHIIREPLTNYAGPVADEQIAALFAAKGYLSKSEAFTVLEAYA